jgi:hypothetical protein
MSNQQPSRAKAWVQTQVAKALFKAYQVKTAWATRFGRKSTFDATEEGETTASNE